MLRPIRMEMTANEPMHSPKDNSTIMVPPFDSSASERRLLTDFFGNEFQRVDFAL